MKKILFVCIAVTVMCSAAILVPNTRHSAKVMGSIDIGNKQVTAILDQVTNCIHKSQPHEKNIFTYGEDIELEISNSGEKIEVIKPNMLQKIFVHPKCKDDGGIGPVLKPKIKTGRGKKYPEESCACSNCNCGPCAAICFRGGVLIEANPDPNENYVDIDIQMVEGKLRFKINETDAIPSENAIILNQNWPLSHEISQGLGGYNMVILKKGNYPLNYNGETYIDVKIQP